MPAARLWNESGILTIKDMLMSFIICWNNVIKTWSEAWKVGLYIYTQQIHLTWLMPNEQFWEHLTIRRCHLLFIDSFICLFVYSCKIIISYLRCMEYHLCVCMRIETTLMWLTRKSAAMCLVIVHDLQILFHFVFRGNRTVNGFLFSRTHSN